MTPIFFKRTEPCRGGTCTVNAIVPRTFWRLWYCMFPPRVAPWEN